jgi:hypothetical protein
MGRLSCVPGSLLVVEINTVKTKEVAITTQNIEGIHKRPHKISLRVWAIPERKEEVFDMKNFAKKKNTQIT